MFILSVLKMPLRVLQRSGALITALVILSLCTPSPLAAADRTAAFAKSITFLAPFTGEIFLESDLSFVVNLHRDGTGESTNPEQEFEQSYPGFLDHLRAMNSYEFVTDWPNVQGIGALNTDYPAFTLQDASAEWIAHAQRLIGEGALNEIGPEPYDVPRVKLQTIGSTWSITVRLHGVIAKHDRGEVHVKPFGDWKYVYLGQTGTVITGSAIIRYSTDDQNYLRPFRGKLSLGSGTGGPAVDFSGEGVLQRSRAVGSHFTTLSIDAKLPLGLPSDVDNVPGGERAASEKVPDTLSISLNRYGYRKGGKLQTMGLRARTTGGFNGAEVVGYYNPSMGWFNQSRGFYATEIEVGWRSGDAEFTNFVTRAPDRGNVVARVGTVVEWAPKIGSIGINRDLARGLRFYIRGRGWLDTFKDAGGDTSVRLRPFLDAELFYNFTDEWRIFARSEYGYVLPDLNTRVSRPIFIGVGAAF